MNTLVILALDLSLPIEIREGIRGALEASGWQPVEDRPGCWKGRCRADEWNQIRTQVRKAVRFAAFTAGLKGSVHFAVTAAGSRTHYEVVWIGRERPTRQVKRKDPGRRTSTRRLPSARPTRKNF